MSVNASVQGFFSLTLHPSHPGDFPRKQSCPVTVENPSVVTSMTGGVVKIPLNVKRRYNTANRSSLSNKNQLKVKVTVKIQL